mmetsp:Transcript_12183/g.28489  ORF Transcript_12183/g.28489 Transcript_12183/m.28489 type:complete len:204 (+) Transcript_12183:721-1332(+)
MTVTPRTSLSSTRNWSRFCLPMTSRSVVTSSSSSSMLGLASPSSSCTLLLCPSLIRQMHQFTSTSSTSISFWHLASSLPSTPLSSSVTVMSPWFSYPHLSPRCATSSESEVSWKAGRPKTLTLSGWWKCLPAMTRRRLDLPAPFAPRRRVREPFLHWNSMSLSTQGMLGSKRKSKSWTCTTASSEVSLYTFSSVISCGSTLLT